MKLLLKQKRISYWDGLANLNLKKHKREGIICTSNNNMRELPRLLVEHRKTVNSPNLQLKDVLLPKHFDDMLTAVRSVVGYDPIEKAFKTLNLAMHLGTSLKILSNELIHLILR